MSTAMFIFEILYNCLVYKLMYKIRPKTCYSKESLSDSFLFIFFFFKHNHIRYRIKSFVYLESPLDSKTAADWCSLANLSSSKIYIYIKKSIYFYMCVFPWESVAFVRTPLRYQNCFWRETSHLLYLCHLREHTYRHFFGIACGNCENQIQW